MIGDMCGLYDSEFNHLPTALGELGPTEDIDLHDFLYPFYHDEVPVPVHPTTQEAINWVDKNGDYVYLGAGRPMSAFAGNEVLAYNKFKYAGKEQMVNVLFADGRVERIPCPDLLTRLRLKPTTAPSRGAAN
jgi:prepilin-type processing-associated H-X9-DG protein